MDQAIADECQTHGFQAITPIPVGFPVANQLESLTATILIHLMLILQLQHHMPVQVMVNRWPDLLQVLPASPLPLLVRLEVRKQSLQQCIWNAMIQLSDIRILHRLPELMASIKCRSDHQQQATCQQGSQQQYLPADPLTSGLGL